MGVPLHKCRTHQKLLKMNSEKLTEKLLNDKSKRYFFTETTNSLIFFINAWLNKGRKIYSILKHTFSKYVLWSFSYPTILEIYCRGNFTGKITMQVLKQFFLIMILNIHKTFFGCNVFKLYIFVLWSCFRR